MKKVLMLLVAGVVAFTFSLASANTIATNIPTDVRIESLSSNVQMVEDYNLIWLYPNKVVEYTNTVDFELPNLADANPTNTNGVSGQEWGGVLDGQIPNLGTVGLYIRRPFTTLTTNNNGFINPGGGSAAFGFTADSPWEDIELANVKSGNTLTNGGLDTAIEDSQIITPENKFDLFWGKDFSGTEFGVMVNYAGNQNDQNAIGAPGRNESQVIGVNVGLGQKNMGFFNQANYHINFSSASFDAVSPTVSNKSDNCWTGGVGVLFQHDMTKTTDMRLFADAADNNFGGIISDNTGDRLTTGYLSDGIDAGIGFNHNVDSGLAIVSCGLMANYGYTQTLAQEIAGGAIVTDTYLANELDSTVFDVPFFVSVESRVSSWLTLRAGANAPVFQRTYSKLIQNHVVEQTQNFDNASLINYSTGFGINWKNWSLDGAINVGSLESTLNFVQPGNGIFFSNSTAIVTVTDADLRYMF